MKGIKQTVLWSNFFLVTFLGTYLYVFNEWLFAITKPSFISNNLDLTQQFQIFLATSALLATLCFLCLLPLVILSSLPPFLRYRATLVKLCAWLPAVIFAALILLSIDNFTYTMFKFGIVSTEGWSRALYGLGFILLIILCYWRVLKTLFSLSQRNRIWRFKPIWISSVLAGVLLLSVSILVLPNRTRASITSTGDASLRPHILLITGDGVDASHMSVYGYSRDTTPYLVKIAQSALVAENAFSNTEHTSGSVISIYTGKYPAATRLFWWPNVLKGDDSYEHLPGILRSEGYKTVQITLPNFLDANKFQLLDSFDEMKMNSAVYSRYINELNKAFPSDLALFMDETINRLADRIRHIFFIEKMVNPYLLVTRLSAQRVDIERWESLRQVILATNQPLFVHIHLMVTHGKTFNPQAQKFSTGQSIEGQEQWNVDFYDDSILEIDNNIGELVDYLLDLGLLDNTVLIIGSDHGQRVDKQIKRIPLIIRFPYGEHAGRIQANVQNMDIAPTILDYIGLDQPDWMLGKSLLAGDLGQRPIFGMSAIDPEVLDSSSSSAVSGEKITSPADKYFFTTLIYCQSWFKLDLSTMSWTSGNVEGSTSACLPGSEITEEQAFRSILGHLKDNDFDISTLDNLSSGTN